METQHMDSNMLLSNWPGSFGDNKYQAPRPPPQPPYILPEPVIVTNLSISNPNAVPKHFGT